MRSASPFAFLSGLTVLELGNTVASSAGTALLMKLGASVLAFNSPDSAAVQLGEVGSQRARSRAVLAEGRTAAAEPTPEAVTHALEVADIVLCDIRGWLPEVVRAATAASYLEVVQARNKRAWTTISPFGLSGPSRDYAGTEMIAVAAGGLLQYTPHPRGGGRPSMPAGFQGSMASGEMAAVSALHAYDEHLRTGQPVHGEVSMQEAVIAAGPFFECAHLLFDCPGLGGSSRYAAPAGVFGCRDGSIFVSAIEEHQWQGIVRALGEPEWAKSIRGAEERRAQASEITDRLQRWTLGYAKDECARVLQAFGVPATPVNTPEDLRRSVQFADRGFLEPVGIGESVMASPTLPVVLASSAVPARDGERQESPPNLAGLRVLDFSQVLGPPLATSWLGAMGADVIKVEDPDRLETYRRIGPFADGEAGIERSAYFAVTNHSKRSVSLRLDSVATQAELRALIEWADVIVENWSTSRANRVGLTYEAMSQINPGVIVVSSSGFGRSGALAGYRAYGHNLHAFGGLMHLTRGENSEISDVGTPWADPLTSIFITALVAAAVVARRGTGFLADVSMAEILAAHLPEFIALPDQPSQATHPHLRTSDPDHAGLSGVYRCAGADEWLAVSIPSPREWRRLLTALETVEVPQKAGLGCFESWLDRPLALEPILDQIFTTAPADDWYHLLQKHSVPASPVWGAKSLIEDEHLAAREFFPVSHHPELGARRVVGMPWRRAGEGPLPLGDTPLLGNAAVGSLMSSS
jgi:crotonobetainyl-CoA:carnitine CoA-transferase CaiB-like acyl-CoA transferase